MHVFFGLEKITCLPLALASVIFPNVKWNDPTVDPWVNLLAARWLSETRRWKRQWVYRRFQISGVMQTTCKIMCVSISLYKSNDFTFKWMRVERGQEYSRDSTTWKEWTKFSPTPLCSWHGESLSSNTCEGYLAICTEAPGKRNKFLSTSWGWEEFSHYLLRNSMGIY